MLQKQRELGLDSKAGTSDLVMMEDGSLRDVNDVGAYGWQGGRGRGAGRGGRGRGRGGRFAPGGRFGGSDWPNGPTNQASAGSLPVPAVSSQLSPGTDALDGVAGAQQSGDAVVGVKRPADAAGLDAASKVDLSKHPRMVTSNKIPTDGPPHSRGPQFGGLPGAPLQRPVPPRPRNPTLLEKLLAGEIRRDRSWLLQAIRFLVVNRFLQEPGDMQYPASCSQAAPVTLKEQLKQQIAEVDSSDSGDEAEHGCDGAGLAGKGVAGAAADSAAKACIDVAT